MLGEGRTDRKGWVDWRVGSGRTDRTGWVDPMLDGDRTGRTDTQRWEGRSIGLDRTCLDWKDRMVG